MYAFAAVGSYKLVEVLLSVVIRKFLSFLDALDRAYEYPSLVYLSLAVRFA